MSPVFRYLSETLHGVFVERQLIKSFNRPGLDSLALHSCVDSVTGAHCTGLFLLQFTSTCCRVYVQRFWKHPAIKREPRERSAIPCDEPIRPCILKLIRNETTQTPCYTKGEVRFKMEWLDGESFFFTISSCVSGAHFLWYIRCKRSVVTVGEEARRKEIENKYEGKQKERKD